MAEQALRVLCVDDNPAVAEALRLTVTRAAGMDCVGCLSTAERLCEHAERNRAEVIVMDLDMPGPDPFWAIQDMRDRRPEVRVVIFTGHVRDDLVDRAFDAGAWGYIAKDGPLDAIVWAIREVAAGRVALPGTAREHSRDAGNGRNAEERPATERPGPEPGEPPEERRARGPGR